MSATASLPAAIHPVRGCLLYPHLLEPARSPFPATKQPQAPKTQQVRQIDSSDCPSHATSESHRSVFPAALRPLSPRQVVDSRESTRDTNWSLNQLATSFQVVCRPPRARRLPSSAAREKESAPSNTPARQV